jgi:hypothetical protein
MTALEAETLDDDRAAATSLVVLEWPVALAIAHRAVRPSVRIDDAEESKACDPLEDEGGFPSLPFEITSSMSSPPFKASIYSRTSPLSTVSMISPHSFR